MFADSFLMVIDDFGEDVEIRRGGNVVGRTKALFGKKAAYHKFAPDADVREGDIITFVMRQKTLTVSEIEREVVGSEVYCLHVFDQTPRPGHRGSSVVNNIGIIAGSIDRSAIQQHSPNARQTLTVGDDQRERLKAAIQVILETVDDMQLDEGDKADVKGDATAAAAQLEKKSPTWDIVMSLLSSVKTKVKDGLAGKAAEAVMRRASEAWQVISDYLDSAKGHS